MHGGFIHKPQRALNLSKNDGAGGSAGEAPDFGSGHGLLVCGIESCIELFAVGTEPASDPLSPSLSAPPLLVHSHMHVLCLSKINIKKKEKEE